MVFFRSPSFTPADLPDLTGKVIFVTGANHGIGYTTVKHLAGRGAKVYLGSRNEAKGLAAVASIEAELAKAAKASSKNVTPGQVIYHHCELNTPSQARESAEKLIERETRLDVLINNAGLLFDKAIEDQIMRVNHFGTFQITQSLLPLLKKTAKEPNTSVRIIFVASSGMEMLRASDPNIQFKTLEDFNADYSKDFMPSLSRYLVSKLANSLTAKALQRRVAEDNITSIVIHPGSVNTWSQRGPLGLIFNPLIRMFFVSPEIGAYNSCFVAASPLVDQDTRYHGAYVKPVGKIAGGGINAEREALQEELWETTVRILQKGTLDREQG